MYIIKVDIQEAFESTRLSHVLRCCTEDIRSNYPFRPSFQEIKEIITCGVYHHDITE